MSSWKQSGLGGGGDIRGGCGGGLRSRGGRGRDGRLVRRGGCGIRRREVRTLPTGTRTTDAPGRRRFFAGLDVSGHLLQLGGTGAKARGTLGGGQRLRRGLTVFRGTGPSTPVTGLGVVTRRQGSGHARAIGAIGGADRRLGGLRCRRLRLLGKDRHGGEQEGCKEEGCSHGGVPFCKPKITHHHPKNKTIGKRKREA